MSMKKNKLVIILSIVFICAILVTLLFVFSKNISKINEPYQIPTISLLTVSDNKLIINAGMYRYGDINKDGKIDSVDLENIQLIIDSKFSYTDDEKKLADLNNDNIVDNKDFDIMKRYLKNKKITSYDINNDLLLYCVNKEDSVDDCDWSNNFEFVLNEETDYFIYVKNKNSNKISSKLKYTYKKINYDPVK